MHSPNRLRRSLALAVAGLALAISAAPAANADPDPDLLVPFTLDCGSAGSFAVAVHAYAPLPKPIFVLDDTRVFRISSLSIAEVNGGAPLFLAPGLLASAVPQLTCHFVGTLTGRHFTVTGFLTPAGASA